MRIFDPEEKAEFWDDDEFDCSDGFNPDAVEREWWEEDDEPEPARDDFWHDDRGRGDSGRGDDEEVER